MAIRDFLATEGYAPNYRQIAKLVGVRSLGTVAVRVHQLVDHGYVTLTPFGRINSVRTIPDDCADLVMCNRGHVAIWFRASFCPLCELLQRLHPPAPPGVYKT